MLLLRDWKSLWGVTTSLVLTTGACANGVMDREPAALAASAHRDRGVAIATSSPEVKITAPAPGKASLTPAPQVQVHQAGASTQLQFGFQLSEIGDVIGTYAAASREKFVVDPGVRGKITILAPDPVSVAEAYNLLSSALAINGFAITQQGDTKVVKSARSVQRDLLEVVTTLPELKPERMITFVKTLRHLPAEETMKDLRILVSRDGEMSVVRAGNRLVFTDWVSNLQRIDLLLNQVDKPDAKTGARAKK